MPPTRERYEKPVLVRHRLGALNPRGAPPAILPGRRICGVDVDALMAQYGSPLFVVSEEALRRRYREIEQAFTVRFPRVTLAYSFKTNYLSAICAALRQEGAWAEVVSGFEYELAGTLGIPGEEIVFNGPLKRPDELSRAVQDRAIIHVDSLEEIAAIEAIAASLQRRVPVGMRVNMRLGETPWDRFGFNLENGDARAVADRIATSPHLRLAGLHAHIGTYVTDPEMYARAAAHLGELSCALTAACGVHLEHLDFGGGFASRNRLHGEPLSLEHVVPPIDRYADAILSGLTRAGLRTDHLPRIIIEPGRALVDESMHLLTTVVSCKRLADGRRGVVLDAGVNVLPTSWWYRFEVLAAKDAASIAEEVTLFGPMCMNIDCLQQDVPLPPLRAGDVLAVRNVGAYNLAQSMQFIQLRPAVVMLGDGRVDLVREAETGAYVRQLEHVPAHLGGAAAASARR